MVTRTRLMLAASFICAALFASPWLSAQTNSPKEEFNATAIANDELGSGAGRVQIRITRWSTDAERSRLFNTLKEKGSRSLLNLLQDNPSVGNTLELETFTIAPIMLKDIEARPIE